RSLGKWWLRFFLVSRTLKKRASFVSASLIRSNLASVRKLFFLRCRTGAPRNLPNRYYKAVRALSILAPTFESRAQRHIGNFTATIILHPNYSEKRFTACRKFIGRKLQMRDWWPVRAAIPRAFTASFAPDSRKSCESCENPCDKFKWRERR